MRLSRFFLKPDAAHLPQKWIASIHPYFSTNYMITKLTPSHLHTISIAATLLLSSSQSALAELKLPAIFGSNMVLQQDGEIPVWGFENTGETVTVSFAGHTAEAVADDSGKWKLTLPEVETSHDGRSMTVISSTGERMSFENVLVGEVWICSGQSNMEMSVSQSMNSKEEIAAGDYPEIRYFDVKNEIAYEPQQDLKGEWVVCSPEKVGNFSAVGYFFGRDLHNQLNRPIGLISTNWSGTVAEAWTSEAALKAKLPEFTDAINKISEIETDVESQKKAYQLKKKRYEDSLSDAHALEADLEAAAAWALPELDESDWGSMRVPENWESAGHKDFDGFIWFRKTIDVPASWAGHDLALRPGPIDEIDVTWFNGEKVGETGNMQKKITHFWNHERDYTVPGKLVKAGKNVIAIRVIDTQGEGGLWGGNPKKMLIAPIDGDETERITLVGEWKTKEQYALPEKIYNTTSPNQPTVLYNQMIAPLVPYGIRGAIWYQGESNASRAEQYRKLLPTMIADWRDRWGRGDFPFLVVQLANFRARYETPTESQWAELREAQAMTAANDANVGLAVTIDIGDTHNIHPINKQDVGKRLSLVAESIAYGREIVSSGPTFKEMKIEGDTAVLTFDHAQGGLVSNHSDSSEVGGFALRGEAGEFVWADATIDGETIHLRANGVENIVAVRYAWANNPEAPLYNKAGLPMVPFRTDAPRFK
jgi:sialate O-acetylesterase